MSAPPDVLGEWGREVRDEQLARALAAAGTIAAQWDQQDSDRPLTWQETDHARQLLDAAGEPLRTNGGPLPWRSPVAGRNGPSLLEGGLSAVALAEMWQQASRAWQAPIRFAMDGTWLDEHPWDRAWLTALLSSDAVASESSAFVDAHPRRPTRLWRWPLRIGAPDGDSPLEGVEVEHESDPDGWIAQTLRPVRIGSRHHSCALLVLEGPPDRWEDWLVRERPEADVVLVLLPVGAALADTVTRLDAADSFPIVAAAHSDRPSDTLMQLIWDITHDLTLDLALASATVRGGSAGAGYLLSGAADSIEQVRLRSSIADAVRDLHEASALPQMMEEPGWVGAEPPTSPPPTSPPPAAVPGSPRFDVLGPTPRADLRTVMQGALDELTHVLERPAFPREDDGAVPTSDAVERTRTAREDAGPVRFVQTRVNGADDRRLQSFVAGEQQRLTVFVGPPEVGAATAPLPFSDELLPPAPEHTLSIVVSSPDLTLAERADVQLPMVGRSSDAVFLIEVPATLEQLRVRITVLHGGRVLQSWMLVGPVTSGDDAGRAVDDAPMRIVLESMPRLRMSDLHTRRPFDAAFVANHDHEDTAGGVAIDATGEPQLLPLQDAQVSDGLMLLRRVLETKLEDDEAPVTIDAPAMVQFLAAMANRGVPLRTMLERIVPGFTLDTGATRRVQLLSATPDAYLPLELVYAYEAPGSEPVLCDEGVALLTSTELVGCPATHAAPVVCPLGFWGLRHVIERRLFVPGGVEGNVGWRAESEPAEGRDEIVLDGHTLFAASDRVDGSVTDTRASTLAAIGAVSTTLHSADDWQAWVEDVSTRAPSLLVVLPHTLDDMLLGPAMSIGASSLLGAGQLGRTHVVAQEGRAVVAVLLGCRTATDEVPFAHFPAGFQTGGASIVIGTLAKVLGRHAGPVAADLVATLLDPAAQQVTLAERLVCVRRRALLDHGPIGLALVAYGDADWVLTTEAA